MVKTPHQNGVSAMVLCCFVKTISFEIPFKSSEAAYSTQVFVRFTTKVTFKFQLQASSYALHSVAEH